MVLNTEPLFPWDRKAFNKKARSLQDLAGHSVTWKLCLSVPTVAIATVSKAGCYLTIPNNRDLMLQISQRRNDTASLVLVLPPDYKRTASRDLPVQPNDPAVALCEDPCASSIPWVTLTLTVPQEDTDAERGDHLLS